MTRQEIIDKIDKLNDEHKGTLSECKGCETCNEAKRLGKLLKYTEKTRKILMKGEDMTTDEIKHLVDRKVNFNDISNALNMSKDDFMDIVAEIKQVDIDVIKRIDDGKEKKKKKNGVIKIDPVDYINMKKMGMSDKEIAEEQGVNPSTILRWKRRKGLNVKRNWVKIGIEEYKKMKRDGKTEEEIAKMFGVSTWTVKKWKKEYGLTGNPTNVSMPPPKEYIKLKREGKTDKEICKMWNVSMTKMTLWKRQNGLTGKFYVSSEKKEGENMKTKKEDIKNKKYEEEKEQLVNAYSEKLLKRNKELNDELLEAKKEVESAEMAIKQLKEDIELERDKQKQMELKHENELKEYADEKQLAYMKAREYADELKEAQEETKKQTELYIQTFNNLEKTDRDLENAKQRIKELESREKQLLLRIEEMKRINDPMRHLLKVVL